MSTESSSSDPPVRFGLGYILGYTALCCIALRLFSLGLSQPATDGGNQPAISMHHVAALTVCLVLLGIAGIGRRAFLVSFNWVGRACVCFGFGGVLAAFAIVFSSSRQFSPQSTLRFAWLGMAVGVLLGVLFWTLEHRRHSGWPRRKLESRG